MLQTVDDKKYIFISGLLSFFIVSLFIIGFLYLMFFSEDAKTYGLKKDVYVSVSLDEIKQPTPQKAKKAPAPKKQVKTKKVVKKQKIDAISEDVDVDSLFDNVWTKKITPKKVKKRKPDIKRIQEIEKSLASVESLVNSTTKSTTQKKSQSKKEIKSGSTGNEVNKYLAKIHAIVYEHFYPPPNTEGFVIRAVIELSPLGKVRDFRILNYSGNEALNQEADAIRKRIEHVVFPKNPKNKSERIVIILKPEAKE